MKRNSALLGLTLMLSALAPAQDTNSERVVVPARNTTHARKVDVSLMSGSITVKGYAGKEVIVESRGDSRRSERERERDTDRAAAAGMHRLDLPARGLTVEEENNVVTVRMQHAQHGELVISVPPDTSLMLRTMQGEIVVEGVKGELDVSSQNGRINLTNVSGSVLANTMNGTMKVTMDSVDPNKPLSFSSMNGTIDVTLPADLKANVKLRTDHGEIYSDFDFKLGGGAITQRNDSADGKFKVTMDRTISGTINGGGAGATEATFKTYNGTIYLRKKK
jgi:Putative adhesin